MTAVQPKNKFTQLAGKVIERMVLPQLHYTGLFGKEVVSRTEQILWESRQIEESIAKSVWRNTKGNANKFNKSSEKMISGVEFHETLNINEILTGLIGYGTPDVKDSGLQADFVAKVKRRMEYVNMKLTRAQEKACAEYFKTGVITYETHPDGFDFNRPASSIVDLGAGEYWDVVTADIETQVSNAQDYFREVALYTGGEFNLTMSKRQWISLKKTNFFTGDKVNVNYTNTSTFRPTFSALGATWVGVIEVAGAIVDCWIYDGKAKGAQGGSTLERYMPNNLAVMTPKNFDIGEITFFPIDSASGGGAGLPQVVIGKTHSWDEFASSSDTLIKHVKSRMNTVAYYENHSYTMQTFA